MNRFLSLLCFCLLFSSQAKALELAATTKLKAGEHYVSIGGGYLYGVISPPDSFTEVRGTNEAKVYEENVRFTSGLGDEWLKDMYAEIESKTFQSSQETVNGTVVHTSNKGWVMNARSGGNFVHTQNFQFGVWIHGGTPVLMNKSKFVNPVVNYFGLGLNAVESLGPVFGLSQSAFIGSGMFAPRTRNPNVQGSFLVIINFGKMVGNNDFILKSGGIVESDLISRVDLSYQSSALGSGRIKNRVFATPFMLEWAFNDEWSVDGSYSMKWIGRSVRGSRFATFNIARKF